jgi:hypothetical protein
VSLPSIDEAELDTMLRRAGLMLTAEQVRQILPGAAIVQAMIARVNAALPREAEPALTFDVEQRGEPG